MTLIVKREINSDETHIRECNFTLAGFTVKSYVSHRNINNGQPNDFISPTVVPRSKLAKVNLGGVTALRILGESRDVIEQIFKEKEITANLCGIAYFVNRKS